MLDVGCWIQRCASADQENVTALCAPIPSSLIFFLLFYAKGYILFYAKGYSLSERKDMHSVLKAHTLGVIRQSPTGSSASYSRENTNVGRVYSAFSVEHMLIN